MSGGLAASAEYGQIFVYCLALIVLAPPLGRFIARAVEGETNVLSGLLAPLERFAYRVSGIDPKEEMNWKRYAWALIAFNLAGLVALFLLMMFQRVLPLNPQLASNLSWHLAANAAVSFVTNTDWQSYSGESALSPLTQMLGLGVQNFLSAATGIAVFFALARGIARKNAATIGNFWVDLTRSTLYVLLPLSIVFAIVLASQGSVQTFMPAQTAVTLEGAEQKIPLGPVASQIAIKQLGSNGGGYFNANSAHPFENPTPLTNFLETLALLLIPAALVFSYGEIVKSRKHAWTLFSVMFVIWFATLVGSIAAESAGNPIFAAGSAMEGKETRIGAIGSVLWSTATTAASNGSVNAMHSSLSPLAGALAMFNIMMGEVIFGGVGSGLYGMLLFVLLTVFLAGLMVGRSPEYMGKKIESREMKMTILAVIGPCAAILLGCGISLVLPIALSSLSAKGPHGLSEMLYAFASAAGNNGSAFAGLDANTPYLNCALALEMLIGRFVVLLPALAIAGSLAAKNKAPQSAGTFATDDFIFGTLLTGVILVVGALTFVPALSLGPIVEHFLMSQGRTF